jgi:hypothetical protein
MMTMTMTMPKIKPAPLATCHLTLGRTSAFACIGSQCSAWDPSTTEGLGRCGLNPSADRKPWRDPQVKAPGE